MNNTIILTNNPDVCIAFKNIARYEECTVRELFISIRDAVHTGARILSHPLSGSVKPWESPYKSVVIAPAGGALHVASLQLIEDAIAKLRTPHPLPDDALLLHDFRILDLDLITSAMEGLVCTTY